MIRLGVFLVAVFSIQAGSAGTCLGQLQEVTWSETVNLASDGDSYAGEGMDVLEPEPQEGSVSRSGFSISGSVDFVSGPPNAAATLNAAHESGTSSVVGSATCRIELSFKIIQISPPPVAVTNVPITLHVGGGVEVSGDPSLFASALAVANFLVEGGALDGWQASANNAQGAASESFDEIARFELAPDVVVFGDLTVTVNIFPETLENNTSASTTAWIDPIVEVANEIIPGSIVSYRDHYEIEFAPGYWALLPSPTRTTTWGRLKRLYENL